MQKKVFSAEIMICATAYIKADSAEEAAAILAKMDKGLEFRTGGYVSEGLAISGKSYDDTRLPVFSLSPSMTAYPGKFPEMLNLPDQQPDDLECVFDPEEDASVAAAACLSRAALVTAARNTQVWGETDESVNINGVWHPKPGFEFPED